MRCIEVNGVRCRSGTALYSVNGVRATCYCACYTSTNGVMGQVTFEWPLPSNTNNKTT